MVYRQLVDTKQILGQLRGKWDDSTIHVVEISAIVDIVGIWEAQNVNPERDFIYILRKHPAINALSSDELGKDSEVANEDQGTENEENELGNL